MLCQELFVFVLLWVGCQDMTGRVWDIHAQCTNEQIFVNCNSPFDPKKHMCSVKWARPGRALGSEDAPAWTLTEAAKCFDCGSLTKRTVSPLSKSSGRYVR